MKVAVVGCRDASHKAVMLVHTMLWTLPAGTEIVTGSDDFGGGGNVDQAAKQAARNQERPFKQFPADWYSHGRKAGPMRNQQIVDYLDSPDDYVLAFWDGKSRGTADTIRRAESRGIRVERIDISKC